jgi:hypothetical protein
VKKITQDDVKACKVTIDSRDHSATSAPGSIVRDASHYIGTMKSDCAFPGPAALGMYDQGEQSEDDTKGSLEMLGGSFAKHGTLEFDPAKAVKSKWYAGGDGALLLYVYEYFDESGKSLGKLLLYPGNPMLSFEGCFAG